MNQNHVYDMIIVGGGPGGYTAALYAARAGLDTVILEKLSAGGQMALTNKIDNYPGFEDGIDGFTLAENMQKQAERFGAKTEYAEVTRMDLNASPKVVETSEGQFLGRTLVLATGANPRELGVAKEAELVGRGVAYCAACDGMFYRGKTVVVVGGGNSAAADALLLSRIAKKVIMVHRRDTLRATKIYHEPLMKAENVELRWNSTVEELIHGERLTGVRLRNSVTGEESVVECDGVFVSVGRKPATELVQGQLELDRSGYVIAGESTATNIGGVYAVGDVRTKVLRQVVTAVADGAMAVHAAEEYLAESGQ
ncbi:MAG: thioredoxin-disulfide reductase [Oscillospiraceae bacterium]|nr:thioredoxin-disulfide reductase [Oscillospiraceae bacterium]